MIEIPVSNGELLDKISILEIKVTMGINEAQKELDLLKRKSKKIYLNVISEGLYKSLKTINSHLWLIEDTKRVYEKDKNFGKHFIEAARAVYILNDERARMKKLINEHTNSEIIEYKSHKGY